MTFGRYVEGLLYAALALGPIGMASCAWRARLLPSWAGATARLAEIVIALSAVTCISEALGAVQLFRTAAVVPVLACVGAAGWYVARRGPEGSAATLEQSTLKGTSPKPAPTGMALMALVAVSVLAADWVTRTVDAFHHGMTTPDTLWYHMPFAARFVQQGTVTPLHYIDSEPATVFFPANSELIHALGILVMGNDVLSPLVNLGWTALALLAAWCIGRPYGVAPVTLTGVCVLLATPGLVATQPGGAYDDIVGLALILACAALLVTAVTSGKENRLTAQAVAALAAGLALGTKFTYIVPVAALTIGIWVLARRGRRLLEGITWLLLVVVTGGFWYVRNLIDVGNPLPSLALKLGPLALPSPPVGSPTLTVGHFLFNESTWRQYFLPGLRLSFGPGWWALLALAGAGLVLGAARGPSPMERMLAWVGMATTVGFIITPQYLTIFGAPVDFVYNVRYADPAVVLGLVLLPLIPVLRGEKRPWWLLGGYVGILAVTQLDGTLWPIDVFAKRFGQPIGGTDSLIGLLFGVVMLGIGLLLLRLGRGLPPWRPHAVAVATLSVALLGCGFGLQQYYLRNRYTSSNPQSIGSLAQNIRNARIGVAGTYTQVQYELYGRYLSNYVQYVGQTEPHAGFVSATSCVDWRQLVNAGHYGYVLTSTNLVADRQDVFNNPSRFTVWTRTDPASTLIRRQISAFQGFSGGTAYVGFSLFRLQGRLDPATCSSPVRRTEVPAHS